MTLAITTPAPGKGAHTAELLEYARSVLQDWQNSRIANFAQQLRNASRATARDYRAWSLLELLQNAHDAHPGDRTDGRVHILLDETDGEHGTLFVANGGTPFTRDRVMAVCKFAMSEKKVGEGIGNKGVGFRSVLELTNAPEIFSSSLGLLDGYRFRFATLPDLVDLLGDADLGALAHAELPDFQVPYPIADLPLPCETLAEAGHVTIIRLPLKSDDARVTALRLWEEMATAEVPVMLFLNRLESLTLELRTRDGRADTKRLSRQERPFGHVTGAQKDADLPEVSMAEADLGEFGRYTMVRGVVPPAQLTDVVDRAVAAGDLDESWQDWAEPAVVEIAIPVTAEAVSGRLYTFLPLGEHAASPLLGHLNAPFFTKVDRTALDETHPLNRMLLTTVAETCLLAAVHLRQQQTPLSRRVAIDLIAWQGDLAALVRDNVQRVHGACVEDVPLVPILDRHSHGQSWGTPHQTIRWPRSDLRVLTAEAACAVGSSVVDTALGARRLNRLVHCFELRLAPSPETLAHHAEQIAARLPRPRNGEQPLQWDDLYVDLYHLFHQHEAGLLRGRRLLLSEDGELRHFNGTASDAAADAYRHQAFFHPTSADLTNLAGVTVPRTLKNGCSIHMRSCRWPTGKASHTTRKPVGSFARTGSCTSSMCRDCSATSGVSFRTTRPTRYIVRCCASSSRYTEA
ncbi:sacsin N-terminal ATP-binding-like domain-containing protein [Nonomuraea sp. NPDC050394]|uniref:sacsin N-terminal ATP-binding-like domain-containing protein n=1 Tax=Nonomuraea sp. NPDC050394 TaxID=3364363 RepID=UPI0037BB0C49